MNETVALLLRFTTGFIKLSRKAFLCVTSSSSNRTSLFLSSYSSLLLKRAQLVFTVFRVEIHTHFQHTNNFPHASRPVSATENYL